MAYYDGQDHSQSHDNKYICIMIQLMFNNYIAMCIQIDM